MRGCVICGYPKEKHTGPGSAAAQDGPPANERAQALWQSYGLRVGWHADARTKLLALASVLEKEIDRD